jgi:hypothetical protein
MVDVTSSFSPAGVDAYKSQNGLLLQNLLTFYRDEENLKTILRVVNGESRLSLRIVDWFVTNYSKKNFTVYHIPTDMNHGGTFYLSDSLSMSPPPTTTTTSTTTTTTSTTTTTTTTTAAASAPVVAAAAVAYKRFNVYNDYKLKLRAYSKRNFDPFCRWVRIRIPFAATGAPDGPEDGGVGAMGGGEITTTIGQLNFFKWAISNNILQYIESNYDDIERDMNQRNTISKKKHRARNDRDAGFATGSSSSSSPAAAAASPLLSSSSSSKTRKKREELSVSACRSVKKENVEIIVRF